MTTNLSAKALVKVTRNSLLLSTFENLKIGDSYCIPAHPGNVFVKVKHDEERMYALSSSQNKIVGKFYQDIITNGGAVAYLHYLAPVIIGNKLYQVLPVEVTVIESYVNDKDVIMKAKANPITNSTANSAQDTYIHGLSLILGHAYKALYAELGKDDPKVQNLFEAYKSVRRALPKKNGKRYGSKEAYTATR